MKKHGESFLHKKNPNIHTSTESEHEQDRLRELKKHGVDNINISNKPDEKISDLLSVLEKTHIKHLDKNDSSYDPRVIERIKEFYHKTLIEPYKDFLAKSATRVEERAARTLGIDAEYQEEQLDQRGDIAVQDLTQSLDQWIDYLASPEESYKMWFRYYVFTNIIQLSDFDKKEDKFPKRAKDTVRLFPEIDRGALSYIQDMVLASRDENTLDSIIRAQRMAETPEKELLTKEKAISFANMSFADQYKEAIRLNGEITSELREETRGEWIRYEKGEEPTQLWKSLQNKGTAWCTKGFATAKTQLDGGDFYVYYTLDKSGSPTIPRIAIRMQGNDIFEVRGVYDKDQNLEPNMTDIAEEKISTLPNPEKFKKKTSDMKKLTDIDNRYKETKTLTKEDLKFLYETDSNIEGFGYKKDPRIEEILSTRDIKEDAPIIFGCMKNEIAWNKEELNEDTKAYIGPWNIKTFEKIRNYPNITYLYESFPDKKIFIQNLEKDITITSPEKAEKALEDKNIFISDYAKDILAKTEFSEEKETYKLVRFSVEQLGFSNGATTDEIYEKAQKLGLELCPAEVGPQLRLKYTGREWFLIAMEPISDRDGSPSVFDLVSNGVKLGFNGSHARPDYRWNSSIEFAFSFSQVRNLETL